MPATMNGAGVQIDASKEPFAIYRASDDVLIWEDPSAQLNNEFSTKMVVNTDRTIVTVTPTNAHALLEKNTEYYITMGKGYIKFEDGSTSPAIQKGDWSFRTKNPDASITTDITMATGVPKKTGDTKPNINAVVRVTWKDSWFDNSSYYYMHDLATAAMALSGAAYVKRDGKPADEKIQEAFTALGFDQDAIQSYNYDVEREKQNNDMVSYSFAAKPVEDNGTAYTLVAIVVKGTSGDEEWYSNFHVGQGNRHAGFQICAEDVMKNLNQYLLDQDLKDKNLKFLVTGHSRGAAVANLTAKELTNSGLTQARNVYGYTFATPAVAVDNNAANYNNIFNIVNGEDFVPRLPLAKWNYKRYGVDLLLPSKSYYGSGYDQVYNAMRAEYKNLTNKEYEPYNDGTQKVDELVKNVSSFAPTVKQYYEHKNAAGLTPYQYFHSLAYSIVTREIGPLLVASVGEYAPVTAFFAENHTLNSRVFSAHCMAAYYSWMDSCTAEELFGNPNKRTEAWFKRAVIACPVDVYVYDEAGTLVASVVNETVGENLLAVNVEEGVKTIDMPNDQNYSIRIVATDEGSVTYTVDEYHATADGGEVLRTVRMNNIAITQGDVLTGKVDDTTYTTSRNYALTKNEGTEKEQVIYADYDSKTPASSGSSSGGFSGTYNYPVNVDHVDGADVTLSDSHVNAGELVTITVKPNAGKQVDKVIVTDASGQVISVSKVSDNQYTFTMPAAKVHMKVTTKAAAYDSRIVLQINNKTIAADNKTIATDAAPVIVENRTLLPVRVVTELLGGTVDWDGTTRTVTLTIDGKVFTMTIGKEIPGFGTSATIINDRTYVPIRYVAEQLGANVEWIAASQQIIVEK